MKDDAGGDKSSDDSSDSDSDSDSDSGSEPDDGELFVRPERPSSPAEAGPSTFKRQPSIGLDEGLLQRFRDEDEEEAVARGTTGLARSVDSDEENDGYEYLPRDSPNKGKGKALPKSNGDTGNNKDSGDSHQKGKSMETMKRPIVIEDTGSEDPVVVESPSKKVKTSPSPEVVIVIDDDEDYSEIEIDEARSCPRAEKDEIIEIVMIKDDEEDEKK
ncbi:uncharacterized protein LY89DRAFT_685167 [Mollisia scopiformis]|uniref:Uncharacterized protein n=1 Tax=Mollisia scopiformis TaxID=149040 RepID=A0A194X8L0_MOLSC|nr:uncharacterized protein LY89DRAFT_685167 [Mollisia scopiformis]KUJ16122.1 hypothetical protein LY89DRAFT_685167 [Mollisia scopiformis]